MPTLVWFGGQCRHIWQSHGVSGCWISFFPFGDREKIHLDQNEIIRSYDRLILIAMSVPSEGESQNLPKPLLASKARGIGFPVAPPLAPPDSLPFHVVVLRVADAFWTINSGWAGKGETAKPLSLSTNTKLSTRS